MLARMSDGVPMTRIAKALVADHRRLGRLLDAATRGDRASYSLFRAGLLRHIGIEEKILLPALRAAAQELPMAHQLRLDHGALAAMLVPSPTPELLSDIRELLALHDPLEEGPTGLYGLADAVLGDPDEVLMRIAMTPAPPLAEHFDGPRAFAAIARLTERAKENRT